MARESCRPEVGNGTSEGTARRKGKPYLRKGLRVCGESDREEGLSVGLTRMTGRLEILDDPRYGTVRAKRLSD
jgi:hypothetical protein